MSPNFLTEAANVCCIVTIGQMSGMFREVTDASELLTYQVTISQPDSYHDPWWQIGNAGSPRQTAAALSELATRCALELGPTGHCWLVTDVRFADDVRIDYFVGSIPTAHLSDQLRETAARILEVTSAGSRGACGVGHSAPPRRSSC